MSAPNFVYAARSLSGSKIDLVDLQVGDDPRNYYTANGDHLPLLQSLDDIRVAIISGSLFGFTAQASTPTATSGSRTSLFVTGSSNDLYFNKNGTLIKITAGTAVNAVGAGSNLSSSYALATTQAEQTMLIGSTFGGGIRIEDRRDIGTGQVSALSVLNSASATGGNQKYSPMIELAGQGFATTPARSSAVRWGLQIRPVEGASDTTGDLVLWHATGSDQYAEKIVIGRTTAASVITSGEVTLIAGAASQASGAIGFSAHESNNGSNPGCITFWTKIDNARFNGFAVAALDDASFRSGYDMAPMSLGESTRRWSSVYVKTISADVSTLTASFGAADSANIVGLLVKSSNTLSNVAARWLNFDNNGTLKGGFGFHPLNAAVFGWQSTGDTFFIDSLQNGFIIQSGVTFFYAAGIVQYAAEASAFRPQANDGTRDLGATGNRWQNVWANKFLSSGSLNVGTSKLAGLVLTTTSASQTNNQQYSPMLEMAGHGFAATPSRSSAVRYGFQVRPIQMANDPQGDLILWKATGSDSYTELFTFTDTNPAYGFLSGRATLYMGSGSNAGYIYNENSVIVHVGNSGGNYIQVQANNIEAGRLIQPAGDVTLDLGASGRRWSTTYTQTISNAARPVTASMTDTVNTNVVAFLVNTVNGWSPGPTAGAKLQSWQSQAWEVASLYKFSTQVWLLRGGAASDTFGITNISTSGLLITGSNVGVYVGGGAAWNFNAFQFTPNLDINNTVGTTTKRMIAVYSRRYMGQSGSNLTLTAGSAAGTAPTMASYSNSNESFGVINITPGASPTAATALFTASFGGTFDTPPFVNLTPVNLAAAALAVTSSPFVIQNSTTTGQFVVMGQGTLTSGTLYQFAYHIGQ